jgi:uncharacterized protein YgbK (DUF1537 family)
MYTLENKVAPKVTLNFGKMPSTSTTAATLQNPASPDPAPRTRRPQSKTPQILVLADDLTGACDSASGFLRSGHSARVWLTEDAYPEAQETVWVRHTASRDMSPSEAAQAVASAARNLPATPHTLLFKKVDSAGRGNIAAEILSARDAYAADLILLAPSFPATGRVVRNGILQITDVAGQSTSIPLAELFPEKERHRIHHAATPADLAQALSKQRDIIICDAETDADLRAIAQTTSALPARILWAGSAGLANALAASNPAKHPAQPQPYLPRTGSIFVSVGTPHNVTQLQLAHLLNTPGTALLSPDHTHLDGNTAGILQLTCRDSDAADIHLIWQQLSPRPYALVLTGGDTAAFVLRVLGAKAIVLKGDVAAGVPWGIIEGGLADQCTVVTKSGGFGEEACLTNTIAFLRGQH